MFHVHNVLTVEGGSYSMMRACLFVYLKTKRLEFKAWFHGVIYYGWR